MMRLIKNNLKHLYYGSFLNFKVAQIDKFFRTKKIEKMIKDRGDVILSNRSFIGTSYYITKLPGKNNPLCNEIHSGAYKFFPMYVTQQQLDDIRGLSSSDPNDELESLLKVLYDAEAKSKAKNEKNNL